MDRPELDRLAVTFCQDGNTLGTTAEVESITIRLESQLPGEGFFYVLQTDGWSFDGPEDLLELIDKVKLLTSCQ